MKAARCSDPDHASHLAEAARVDAARVRAGQLPATASELRVSLNALAGKLFQQHGFTGPERWDFEHSVNARERQMFALARVAYEHFHGDSPDPADLEDVAPVDLAADAGA